MSATATADPDSSHPDYALSPKQIPDKMEANQDLPARTMADGEQHELIPEHIEKDDPATIAASEELKHTTISDKTMAIPRVGPTAEQRGFVYKKDKSISENPRSSTPESNPTNEQDEEMRERISSPKKKRGRDIDDEGTRGTEDDNDDPSSSADGSVSGGRTTRSEPEKKRPRDTSEEGPRSAERKAAEKAAKEVRVCLCLA